MYLNLLFCCCFSCLFASVVSTYWQLKMANVLYRHGDRSPIFTYPKDMHINFWKQGLGQLTEIGMKQEFNMGNYIKKRYVYSQLLNQTYLRKQVYCRSSDIDRCLMSAEAQMAGLYPPLEKGVKGIMFPTYKEWQYWQLIPIHTVPKDHDQLLRPYEYYDCPRLSKILQDSYKDPKYVEMENKYKDFIGNVSQNLGLSTPLTLAKIYQAYDTFFCQRAHNLSWPDWLTEDVFKKLQFLQDFNFRWLFGSPERARLTGGVLLKEMIQNMVNFKTNPMESKKLFVYSAHDSTVVGLLSALNIYNGIPPPYSTAFFMELYHSKSLSKYSVRMFYRNDTSKPDYAYQLSLPKCQPDDCLLNSFVTLTSSAVPTDLKAECHKDIEKDDCTKDCSQKSCKDILTAILIILLLIFIAVVGIIVRRCQSNKRKSRSLEEFRQIAPNGWDSE